MYKITAIYFNGLHQVRQEAETNFDFELKSYASYIFNIDPKATIEISYQGIISFQP